MILTWLPLPSFKDSLEALSDTHLITQRWHALHAIETLHEVDPENSAVPHPFRGSATKVCRMWFGYELQLCEYGLEVCEEYGTRIGKRDVVYDAIAQHLEWATSDTANMGKPPWFGNIDFHVSHQAALLRLDPEHYKQTFMVEDEDQQIVWPVSGYDG